MADVLFKIGLQATYDALESKSATTFYACSDTNNFYLGATKLSNAADLAAAVADIAQNAADIVTINNTLTKLENTEETTGSIRNIIVGYIGGLDGNITGSGKFATQLSETDGVVSAVMADLVEADIPSIHLSKIADAGTAAAADKATTAITEGSTDTSLVSAAQVATFVESEISDLEGAMHFRGVVERQGSETDAQALARAITNPASGDAAVMADNSKEYLYTGSAWREIGDEGLYVKKSTTIAGVDLQDNITKDELLQALNVEDGAEVNQTIAEGSTNGTIAVDNVDVAVHGLGTAAYQPTTAFDAAGTAAGLIAALDADVDASGTALHSGTFVVSGITETDGVITGVDSVEVEAAGAAAAVLGTSSDPSTSATVYGAKAKTAALETYVGSIPSGSSASDVIGYVDEQVADATLVWGTF